MEILTKSMVTIGLFDFVNKISFDFILFEIKAVSIIDVAYRNVNNLINCSLFEGKIYLWALKQIKYTYKVISPKCYNFFFSK
jgi:hypothetical protein